MSNTPLTLKEYEALVIEKLGDKPVIKMIVGQNIPFEKWGANIHRLVDEAMGAKRETMVTIKQTP